MNETGPLAVGGIAPARSESVSAHRLALARDLLDDLELSRLSPDAIVLKASRLARLVEDADVQEWLAAELHGYEGQFTPAVTRYAKATGRMTDVAKGLGYWQPFAGLSGMIRSKEVQLTGLRLPDVNFAPSSSNPNEWVTGFYGQHAGNATRPLTQAMQQMTTLTTEITFFCLIISKITALLHAFVSKTYYELAFRGIAEGIFEQHKRETDALLARSAGRAMDRIPAVSERLAAGDPEAISQAMSTCRRILHAFADAIQPSSDEKVKVGTELWDLGPDKYMNRLRYYLVQNCSSNSRRERLRHTINHLNDRFSAGTHADMTVGEANALFVILYTTLGELLSCKPQPPIIVDPGV